MSTVHFSKMSPRPRYPVRYFAGLKSAPRLGSRVLCLDHVLEISITIECRFSLSNLLIVR